MKQEQAKKIFKSNFIGPSELQRINKFKLNLPKNTDDINLNLENIDSEKYILIYGCKSLENGSTLDICTFIKNFGFNYDPNGVCFYNQDWYLEEKFAKVSLENRWYLIQKNIEDNTRGKEPSSKFELSLPSAILCVYTFMIWWLLRREFLWPNDFIWCSDFDKHGDRIYVGKYLDVDKVERSGFSIHRHLSIKNNYGMIKSR